jgi:hypothetical protein
MKRIDRDAMRRAIEEVRQRGGQEQARIEAMLAREGFEAAGAAAAYSCQDFHLKLDPWQTPPCWLRTAGDLKVALTVPYGDYSGQREAAELVVRLCACKLSHLEPNPLEALERVEALEDTNAADESADVGQDPDERGDERGPALN